MLSTRLWRHGPFVRFFAGATLSIVGNWFNTVAIAVLTYRLTGQIALVAVAIATSVLPRVLLGPLAGALADRFERRSLLITLDSARALIALLPLLVHDRGHLWLLYAAVALLQVGACLYNPAQGAYVPHLVPDELLEPANAAFATMRDVGMFAGPALATLLLGLVGTAGAFWGNALSFALSAWLLLTLPRVVVRDARAVDLRALVGGYAAIVRRYPRIAALYPCYLACSAPIFFFQGIMVAYARDLGQPATFIGVLYAAAGLGGALGGLAMGQYQRRLPYAAAIAVYILSAPLLGALALTHSVGLALFLLLVSTAAGTAGELVFTVVVQRHVTPRERGRAFGLLFWCIAVGQLIGAGLGVAFARVALSGLLWLGIAAGLVVLIGVALSIRAGRAAADTPVRATVEAT